MSLSIEALRRRLTATMNLDARRLSSRLHGVKKLPEAKQAAVLETIAADLDVAQTRYQSRLAGVPKVTYPDNLPVSQKQGRSPKKAIERASSGDHRQRNRFGQNHPIPKICLALGRGVKGFISHTSRAVWRPVPSRPVLPRDGVRAWPLRGLQGALPIRW